MTLMDILDFQNLKVLVTIQVDNDYKHRHDKFHQNRSNSCGDIAF